MPRVDINGAVVEFPDDLSPDELNSAVSQAAQQMGGQPQDSRGLIRKGWDALAIPEQKSREGLQMLAGMVPNPQPKGNLPLDLARGTPRIAADTLAEVAPGFVSRGSLLTAGAAEAAGEMVPLVKTVLRGIGKQGEQMSGIAPQAEGALEAAYKDPTLIFAKGKKAAGGLYEAAKEEVGQIPKTLEEIKGSLKPISHQEVVSNAVEKAMDGTLNPVEALEARKSADALLKSKQYAKDPLLKARNVFDSVAKQNNTLSEADTAYKRGVQAESLRNFFPQNKYGGASPFKTLILKLTGGLAAPALSPVVQGGLATGTGVVARQVLGPLAEVPQNASAVNSLIQALMQRKKK